MTVRVYTRLKIDGVRQPYKKVNLKKLYHDDTLFTLGWGGKKPLTLPPGTSLQAALLAAKQKELELMQAPPAQSAAAVAVAEARLSLAQAHSAWSDRLPKKMKRDGSLIKESTIKTYRNSMRIFLAGCEKKFLDEIDMTDLENFRDEMLDDDYADGAVETRLDAVCIFLHSHDIFAYPNLSMKHPQTQARVPLSLHYYAKDALVTSFSSAEYDALFAASTPEEKMRWATLRGVGYRKNEQAHAEFTDFRGRVVSIAAKPRYDWKPKSDAGTRLVTVPGWLTDMVEQWHREHPHDKLLFPNTNGQPETGSKLLHRLKVRAFLAGLNCGTCEGRRYDGKTVSCREAPVCSHWKLHRFRASFATDHYKSGKVTELQIMAWLGHSDFKVTQRYLALAKATDPSLCAAVDATWHPVDVDTRLAAGA